MIARASSDHFFLAGFVGGALAAGTYTILVVVLYRALRAQRRGDPT